MIANDLNANSMFTCFFDVDITINHLVLDKFNSPHFITTHKIVLTQSDQTTDLHNINNINCIGNQPDFVLTLEVKTINENDLIYFQEKI
jgi:hypothetical protein